MAKPTLIFSLDQGHSNGVQAANDLLSIQRMATALQPLRAYYDVCFGLTPTANSWPRIMTVLDQCAGSQVPFVLDVVSSDVLGMGLKEWRAPYDIQYGVAQPVQRMWEIWGRYGGTLRGFRLHETMSETWVIDMGRSGQLNWWDGFKLWAPPDDFFQLKKMEPFVAFAAARGLFVIWSDPLWSYGRSWDTKQLAREQVIRDVTNAYRNTVIPMYANNLGGSAAENNYWPCLWPVFTNNTRGWGLSDQSFLIPDANALGRWAQRAIRGGASVVEFEPAWFWFNLPVGAFTDVGEAAYVNDPAWANRGYPTANFNALVKWLTT